ncbi:hypothetical protein [Xanthomonas sp. XNM01]|uniref:hypothetical protein n=1 Tax=Xanthomonas sp. XNM01 TaxID=2769289 RepID=UPI001782DA49|nr:hypothetical protein [Xanthomonas sp. XNM01]MBD9368834.1 hypothetical protein [Xanthomonas sp. XNM01]
MRALAVAVIAAAAATGCMNLATKPAEITGSYTSDLKYGNYTCDQLGIEVNSLARREDQLAVAQEQRRKSSKVQAFWMGYGHGDGIEASELANVRGEKEAVRRAMDRQSCSAPRGVQATTAAPAAAPTSAATSLPATPASEASNNWRSWGTRPASAAQPGKPLYRCPGPGGTEVVSDAPAVGCTVIQAP